MLLKDCATIKGGKRLPKGQTLQNVANDHPYIRVKDMQGRYVVLDSSYEYVPDSVFPSISRYTVETNDIILSIVGTVGLVALVDESLNNASLTENCVKLINIKNHLPEFIYYYLYSDKGQAQISEGVVGSTQPKLPLYNIEKLDIPDISMNEQQHIVDILRSIDNSIENNNKKIENLINFGQLKYQEDISSNDYEYIALSKLVKISRGASPRPIQNYLTTTGHSWVKISDVTSLSAPFLFETKEYITDEGTNHSVAVYPNDLILSNSATPGIPVFMETNAFVHDGWLIIRDFNRITPNYLFWVLKNDRNIILSQGNGSIFTNLKTDILKSHEIPVPSKEKMEKLDNLYSTILLKIKHLTKENLKLNELKQLYLKKFFG